MAVRTRFTKDATIVPEEATAHYSAIIRDEFGAALGAPLLTALTLTLYDGSGLSRSIINAIEDINILNAGRGTLDDTGHLVITLQPSDNIIVSIIRKRERHVMLIEWTYSGCAKIGRHEVEFFVQNLNYVGV